GFNVTRFGDVGEASATNPGFQTAGDDRIHIPFGIGTPGQITTKLTVVGNLSSTAADAATVPTAIQIFDSKGTGHVLSLTFTKTAADPTTQPPTAESWSVTASVPAAEGSVTGTLGPITFNTDGSPKDFGTTSLTFDFTKSGGLGNQTVAFDLGAVNGFGGLTE